MIGSSFSCNVKRCSVIGRSSDFVQTCRKVDTVSKTKCFKRNQSLIVIAGYYGIKITMLFRAKKAIGRVRTVNNDVLVKKFFYCVADKIFFFVADNAVVATMRIESQKSYFWFYNIKILNQ